MKKLKYLIIILMLFSLNIKAQTYKIQYLSKSYIDSTYVYEYSKDYNVSIESSKNNSFFRYLITPKEQSRRYLNELLLYIREKYPDAFIVVYTKEKGRIN